MTQPLALVNQYNMEEQQEQQTCLGYLRSAQRQLHEAERIGADNLEMLAADREKICHIAKSCETIHRTFDSSEQTILEMEHPWSLWKRKAKIPQRNTDILSGHCSKRRVTPQTWRMKGFLQKRMHWTKKWKPRYCVIDGEVLHYYKKQSHKKPRGTIVLAGATITEHAYTEFGIDNCFSIMPQNARHAVIFECPRPADYRTWITHLQRATHKTVSVTSASGAAAASSSNHMAASTSSAPPAFATLGGPEEDEAVDDIISTLDSIDVINRVTREELDDQTQFLKHITDSVVHADQRATDGARRVRLIRV